jgi:hypothetical protein
LGQHSPQRNSTLSSRQPANMSTTAAASSQNSGAASSTQTNGGALHQSPPRAPSPPQIIHGEPGLDQVQVQDWETEASKDEATEEEDLLRVQQEIERLWKEQESIMRRQAALQHTKARRQHINKERARLAELQYIVNILRQQEQRQEPLLDQL